MVKRRRGVKKLTSPDVSAGAFSVSNTDLSGRVVSLVAA